jgi:hypothetical protein
VNLSYTMIMNVAKQVLTSTDPPGRKIAPFTLDGALSRRKNRRHRWTVTLVRKAVVAFDRVRRDALSRGQSPDLILRLADELWKT